MLFRKSSFEVVLRISFTNKHGCCSKLSIDVKYFLLIKYISTTIIIVLEIYITEWPTLTYVNYLQLKVYVLWDLFEREIAVLDLNL